MFTCKLVEVGNCNPKILFQRKCGYEYKIQDDDSVTITKGCIRNNVSLLTYNRVVLSIAIGKSVCLISKSK